MVGLFNPLRRKTTASVSKDMIDTFQSPDSHFHSLFEHFPDIIIEFDTEGKVLTTNSATTIICGYELSDMEKMVTDFSPEDYKEEVWKHFKAAAKGKAQQFFSKAYHKDGSLLNLEITYIPILKEKKTVGVYGVIHEISDKYRLQQELNQKKTETEKIYDSLKAGIWAMDVKTDTVKVCTKGIKEISELEPSDILEGRKIWRDIVHKDDLDKYDSMQKRIGLGESFNYQYRIITPSGKTKWIQDQAIPIFDEDGTLILNHGIVYDITKDKEMLEKVNHLLHHDPLTSLPNRKELENRMSSLIDTNESFAFIYIDLDRFKYINDTLGSAAGDEILAEAAARLSTFQDRGIFISRVSSDEFALVFTEYKKLEEIQALCKEAIELLKKPFYTGEFELFLTVSIGVSVFPSDSDGLQSIFQNAHAAVHRAKEAGKNTFQIYTPEISIDAYKRFILENDFRQGLLNGDLEVYYQPRVDIRQKEIVGAEALLRWEHPEWGTVSPNEFIPIAEENGFIIEVGKWVLGKVCETLKEWEQQGLPLVPISVNLSPQHFLLKDLKETFLSTLKKYSVPPHLIELEITEAAFLQNEDTVVETIKTLRSLGVKIFIDDFGMGYTSFSYLRDQNFDGIKIDRAYVKEIGKNEKNNVIIKSLIGLAAGLGMSAVVEGAETKEQLEFLKRVRCKYIQGYIFSKPLPAKGFINLLKQGKIFPSGHSEKSHDKDIHSYFRIDLPNPLKGTVTIKRINERAVKTGKTVVAVNDIGPGGLSFTSHIQFPVRSDMVLELQAEVMGETLIFPGLIVWKEEVDDEHNDYGIEFLIDETERETITKTLNKLTLALKQSEAPPGTALIQGDPVAYLEKIKDQ